MAHITFWKNDGTHKIHRAFSGKTFELFRVSWDEDEGEWVRDDENGSHWGLEHPEHDRAAALYKPPELYGHVEYENEEEYNKNEMLSTRLDMGTPTLEEEE